MTNRDISFRVNARRGNIRAFFLDITQPMFTAIAKAFLVLGTASIAFAMFWEIARVIWH